MSYKTIILSPTRDFSELGIVTDGYIPERNIWVGDYPYLNKDQFKSFTYEELKKKKFKKQQQEHEQEIQDTNEYDNDDNLDDKAKVTRYKSK